MAKAVLDIATDFSSDKDQINVFFKRIRELDLKVKSLGIKPNGFPMFKFKGTKRNIETLYYYYENNLM